MESPRRRPNFFSKLKFLLLGKLRSKKYTNLEEKNEESPLLDGESRHSYNSIQGPVEETADSSESPIPSTETPSTSTDETIGTQHEDPYLIQSASNSHSSTECQESVNWKEIEGKSQHEQKRFLEKYLKEKFIDEPVSSKDKNVKKGDHIFHQGTSGVLYFHHLLCTAVEEEVIHIIEYTGRFGSSAASRSAAKSNPFVLGTIKESEVTYECLEKKKATIRKWPQELERFNVNKVIERALKRKEERDYSGLDNNCEHFVNWCKCGLSISLQVKPWHKVLSYSLKSLPIGAWVFLRKFAFSEGAPFLLAAIGNVPDEIKGVICGPCSAVGFAFAGVIEACFAAWNIRKGYQRNKKLSLPKRQFKVNTVGILSKAVFRVCGGIAGSIIGSALGPLGSIFGAVIGCLVGNFVGLVNSLCYEHEDQMRNSTSLAIYLLQMLF